MKDISNKFHLFLLNKKKEFLSSFEIEEYFKEFKEMWDLKIEFYNVYKTLKQQHRIIFIFNKIWKILSKEERFKFNNNELSKQNLIEEYLTKSNVNWYYGLSSAKYYLQKDWQSLNKMYIINDKYNKKIKIEAIELNLVKIPKKYFIKSSLIQINNKLVSNLEKTYLDEIYFKSKNIYFDEDIDIELLNLYLNIYSDKKEIRAYVNLNLPKDKLI